MAFLTSGLPNIRTNMFGRDIAYIAD